MAQTKDLGCHTMEPVPPNDQPVPDSSAQADTSPIDMLRIKQQMFNQCFEMDVHLQTGKPKTMYSSSEAERDMLEFLTEIEALKTNYFINTLAVHRKQMWHALAEKLKRNDADSYELKGGFERCMALSSQILQLRTESMGLQEEISELQKKRLEMKRLTHEKMKEMGELKSKSVHPDSEKYKEVLEKGQTNLEKYKKMSLLTQNVLRGLLLAFKINWMDDPKLYDIAMTLGALPIAE